MQGHSSRSHSELPPSSADKWLKCYGWRRTVGEHYARFGVPPSSSAADEGTKAHEKFEAHLATLPSAKTSFPSKGSGGGKPARRPKEAPAVSAGAKELDPKDPDYEPLMQCIEWVEDQEGTVYLESALDFGEPFGYHGLTGTVDVTIDTPTCLTIADLKFGRFPVEVRDPRTNEPNPQLMCYLLGAVNALGERPEYRIVVLQPRASHPDGPIRVTKITRTDLNLFRFDLENALEGSYAPSPSCTVGEWCRKFCHALPSCKAFVRESRRRMAEEPIE